MANHKSALKRANQNQVRRLRNRMVKTRVKSVVKEVRKAAAEKTGQVPAELLKTAQSIIDNAAKKGALHKRSAARKISRLTRKANKITA